MNRILIGTLLLTACQELPKEQPESNTWISGEIRQAETRQLELYDPFSYLVSIVELKDEIFRIDLNVESGAYYVLKHGKTSIPLYLAPGYQLKMTLESGKSLETLTFEGRGKESNQYIQAFEAFERANKPSYDQLLSKTEEEFLVEARRYRSKSEAFLNNYQLQHFNLDPKFLSKERARILYAWANRLIHYPEAHIYFTGEDDFAVSDTYHDYMKTVNLDAVDLISLPEYQTFIKSYIDSEADILREKGDMRDPDQIKFEVAIQSISEQEVKDFAMYYVMSEVLADGINSVSEDLTAKYLTLSQNSAMRAEIKELFQKWLDLQSGETAPPITAHDLKGEKFSLHDFKGRFVYISFWASWCTPCHSDYENLKSLRSTLDKEEIAFITLSLDDDADVWAKQVTERKSDDITEWRIAEKQIPVIKEKFVLKSLPRYVLLDPEGQIISATAPGPADPSLLHLLAMHAVASE